MAREATVALVLDVYARVSRLGDDRQRSTEGQVEDCQARIAEREAQVGEVHIDSGRSAWNPRMKRPTGNGSCLGWRLTSPLRATGAPAGAARLGRLWHTAPWTAGCSVGAPARPQAATRQRAASRSPARAGVGALPGARARPGRRAGRARADRLWRQLPVRPPYGHEHRPRLAPRTALRQPPG